jgi:hypothetical protein
VQVYDYRDTQEHAQTWMEDLNDDELEASVYRRVEIEIPACIKQDPKTFKHALHVLDAESCSSWLPPSFQTSFSATSAVYV